MESIALLWVIYASTAISSCDLVGEICEDHFVTGRHCYLVFHRFSFRVRRVIFGIHHVKILYKIMHRYIIYLSCNNSELNQVYVIHNHNSVKCELMGNQLLSRLTPIP